MFFVFFARGETFYAQSYVLKGEFDVVAAISVLFTCGVFVNERAMVRLRREPGTRD